MVWNYQLLASDSEMKEGEDKGYHLDIMFNPDTLEVEHIFYCRDNRIKFRTLSCATKFSAKQMKLQSQGKDFIHERLTELTRLEAQELYEDIKKII